MHFRVKVEILKAAVDAVAIVSDPHAVGSRSAVRIRCLDGQLQVAAYDVVGGAQADVPSAEVEDDGEAMPPLKGLRAILATLDPLATVALSTVGDRTLIQCGRAGLRLESVCSTGDWPDDPPIVYGAPLQIPTSDLTKLIHGTIHAMGRDKARPGTMGLHLQLDPVRHDSEAKIRIQAITTDGLRLATETIFAPDVPTQKSVTFTLPAKIAKRILAVAAGDDEVSVEVQVPQPGHNPMLRLRCGTVTIEVQALINPFPVTDRIFGIDDPDSLIRLKKDDFAEAIDMLTKTTPPTAPIGLQINETTLRCSWASSLDQLGREDGGTQISGDGTVYHHAEARVGCMLAQLRDGVAALPGPDVTLRTYGRIIDLTCDDRPNNRQIIAVIPMNKAAPVPAADTDDD